jgi:dTDP-4-dehydrorhamnose 3,5-epimerase
LSGGIVEFRPLAIEGAWEITPRQFADHRGVFLEAYNEVPFAEAIGHRLAVAQTNVSTSAAGVVRGIHFADVPPGQAKYVTCVSGAVWDVVIDIRVGSPTFGEWEGVLLDDVSRRAVYLSEGLGHAFMSLEEGSAVTYLCSASYNPGHEREIHPLDPEIGIEWPTRGRDGSPVEPRLSGKDADGPTLSQARKAGLLPTAEAVRLWRSAL